MYYHIITKFGDQEKEILGFHKSSSTPFTIFEKYINRLQKEKINSITFDIDRLNEIRSEIKFYLDNFFQNEYEKKYTGGFWPKTYQPIEFCGVVYHLDILEDQPQTLRIHLHKSIEDIIQRKGSLILYDESYRRK